jgi:hypothetical protein
LNRSTPAGLERQVQALQRQDELLAQQRERPAGLSKRSEQADQLLAKSAKVVAGARNSRFSGAVVCRAARRVHRMVTARPYRTLGQ